MLYVYDKNNNDIKPCIETQFKSHGLLERRDLSKWIEENPSILGEELYIITSEYDKFDKTNERFDLLGIDKEGILVIIELKRDDSGKNVDLQAVKYAAYCSNLTFDEIVLMNIKYQTQKGKHIDDDLIRQNILDFIDNDEFEELNDKPRIILVSKEFRPEVTATTFWLRKFGLDISCVKLDPYILDDNKIAINSSILIPLPEAKDYLMQAEKKDASEHTKSLTQKEYLQFYSDAIKVIKKVIPREYNPPAPQHYYQISTGIGSVHFEWAFHGRPRSSFGVELHIEKEIKK